MLPAAQRLRRRGEFTDTVRRGRRAAGAGLVLHLAALTADRPPRVGFVVGRDLGPAVTRNLVRRRLRHLMAARLAALPDGSQVVVRATAPAATLPYPALARTLDTLLARLGRAASTP